MPAVIVPKIGAYSKGPIVSKAGFPNPKSKFGSKKFIILKLGRERFI